MFGSILRLLLLFLLGQGRHEWQAARPVYTVLILLYPGVMNTTFLWTEKQRQTPGGFEGPEWEAVILE